MFRFAHSEFLYLLFLIPLLMGLFYYGLIIKSKRLKRMGEKRLLSNLMPEVSHIRPRVKFYLSLVALTLLIYVAAGPQYGSKKEKVKHQGIEMMVCIDVSNSMLSDDVKPDRMSRAKQVLGRLIDKLENDKVGLIVFAGDAYVQMPMTTDVGSAKMFLNSINPGMVSLQGTDIASAIRMSMGMFSEKEGVSHSIVIITDGEDHEAAAVDAAKMALQSGVSVNVMGLGTPQGGPIPIKGTNSFRKDREGNVIITRLNEQMCADIAAAGGGVYVRADNANNAVRALSKELDKLAKTDMETEVYSNFNEQYASFAVVALLLILLELCLMDKQNPLLKNVKLF
ncbi:MAG: VWA domain-containing protein [Paludibacteraceae bacterium]|nr:VWA domain-containing protein [Paludibacteraceae bacterium]